MSSHSALALRRVPRQMRGRVRVARFLRAAEAVITETGYDRATMSAIAERANSSIGSLYQFFPNKKALAEAVRVQCIQEIEHRWRALAGEAGKLTTEELVNQLVAVQLELIKNHPALLALLDVAPGTSTSKWRAVIRKRIAAILVAHKPRLSQPTALRIAGVVQQVSRGLLILYRRTGVDQKASIIEEFRCVLNGYLASKLHS